MRMKYALMTAVMLTCASSAEASWRYTLYGGVPIEGDAMLVEAYERTLDHCTADASAAGDSKSLHYDVVVRACLYRKGFFEGTHAYPVVVDR